MHSGCDLRIFGIAQTGFSGSTLLAFMLGAHSRVFVTGEAHQLFRRYREVSDGCRAVDMCSVHHEQCDFWTKGFLAQCERGDVSAVHTRIASRFPSVSVAVHSFLFDVYAQLLREGSGLDGLIVLFKRPVAYYCSRKVHVGGSVGDAAARYISGYREINDLSENHGLPVAAVFYDDLATKLRETLPALCTWLGLAYEPVMTKPWEAVDRLHTIGGNAGTYMNLWDEAFRDRMLDSPYWQEVHGERGRIWLHNNYRKIKLDDRWKSLPPEEIQEMEACTEAQEMFEMLMAQRLLPNPENRSVTMYRASECRDS